MKTIILTYSAAKDLDKLPTEVRHVIDEALAGFAITGLGDVKRLQNQPGFRLRIGRYRVLFLQDAATITVVYIGKRETTTYRR